MLDLAILGFLYEAPMHGYELKQRLTMLAGHFRPVSDGALYPAIGRLEKQNLIIKKREIGEKGLEKIVLYVTEDGKSELLTRLASPANEDISSRNRLFTYLAFLKYLKPEEQIAVLQRRLDFLLAGKSFFHNDGVPVKYAEEKDLFRQGMLYLAMETSKIERQWLKETLSKLEEVQ